MADLDVAVTILGGTDNLPTLALTEAAGYTLTGSGLTIGGRTFRRQTVTSLYVASRTLVGAVLDVMTGRLALRVAGTTHAELRARTDAVVAAMSQLHFTLRVVIEGQVDDWRCECADSAVGDTDGTYDEVYAMSLLQPVTFSFPHDPPVPTPV